MQKTSVSQPQRRLRLPAKHLRAYYRQYPGVDCRQLGWHELNMDSHEGMLHRLAMQTMRKLPPNSSWSVEDLIQDCKQRLWAVCYKFNPDQTKPVTWVSCVIRNHLANILKCEARSLKGCHRILDEEAQAAALDNYEGNASAHPNYPPGGDVAFSSHVSDLTMQLTSLILSSEYMAGGVDKKTARCAVREARVRLKLTNEQFRQCQEEIAQSLVLEGSHQ